MGSILAVTATHCASARTWLTTRSGPIVALSRAARRTRETWEGIAAAFSPPPPVSDEDRLYGAGHDAILAVIAETGPATENLLVIGHNPGLHKLARRLIATGDVEARERLSEALPTSGLVVIDFVGDNWHELRSSNGRLERFVTPRSLRAASD